MPAVLSKIQNYADKEDVHHAALQKALDLSKRGQHKCQMLMEMAFDIKDDLDKEFYYLNLCDNISLQNKLFKTIEKWVNELGKAQRMLPDVKGHANELCWKYGNDWAESCLMFDRAFRKKDCDREFQESNLLKKFKENESFRHVVDTYNL